MTHWSINYIGKPWENGAQGPEAFDCWGFVRAVYSDVYGIEVPAIGVDANAPLAVRHAMTADDPYVGWQQIDLDELEEGDVVTMGKGRFPDHVGVWLDAGGMLHCIRGNGVVFQTTQSLKRSGYNMKHGYRRSA